MPQPELLTPPPAAVEQRVYEISEEQVEGRLTPGCRAEATFPGAGWPDNQAAVAKERAEAIAALEAYSFPAELDWAEADRTGVRTDGVVVIHHGQLIYEHYSHGYNVDRAHLAWSVSKTFNAALAGIAVREGRLDPLASICSYMPELPGSSCDIRVVDLLEFSSGLDWHESYEGSSPTASSVLAMLYGEGRPDMATFVAQHTFRDKPGSTYQYSSGDSNLLAAVVRRVMEPQDGARYPWSQLFEPLGMTNVTWERDFSGTIVGSSYLYASPRDLARFGWLLREGGCWNGKMLLPNRWVHDMAQVSPGFKNHPIGAEADDVQGRQLWLNQPVPEQGRTGLPWPSVPTDAIAARGHWGQSIVAIPSLDLVVVRTADDRDGSFSLDRFLALAMAVAGEGPVPAPPPVVVAAPAEKKAAEKLPPYQDSLLELAASFSAKETCSCRYVLGMDEAFCDELTRVSPNVASARANDDEREVRASALLFWGAKAHWLDAERGCVLD
ncbi:MAG TPA: serine hydrolase [Myxococcota bacterium]|nr:serine hydrolase [Myxococcota bacterium]